MSFQSSFGAVAQTVMDTLAADGVIGGHGLIIPTVHMACVFTHIEAATRGCERFGGGEPGRRWYTPRAIT